MQKVPLGKIKCYVQLRNTCILVNFLRFSDFSPSENTEFYSIIIIIENNLLKCFMNVGYRVCLTSIHFSDLHLELSYSVCPRLDNGDELINDL